jgi:hypothetical protein
MATANRQMQMSHVEFENAVKCFLNHADTNVITKKNLSVKRKSLLQIFIKGGIH